MMKIKSRLYGLMRIFFLLLIIGSAAYIGFFGIEHALDKKRTADTQALTQIDEECVIDGTLIEKLTREDEQPEPGATIHADTPEEKKALEKLSSWKKTVIDHTALRSQNPDYIGWISIPDTDINYPVYKCEDNYKYLHHDADNKYLYAGCIYRDANTKEDSRNTVLHGHNMKTGSMFAQLNQYLNDESFFSSHPFVLFYPDGSDEMQIYEIYSIYKTSASKAAKLSYLNSFDSNKTYKEFLNETKSKSIIDTYCTPGTDDCILTLSTCTGSQGSGMRCIIHTLQLY